MDDIKFNKYRQAGDIANVTLEKAKSLCHDKLKASYICNFCDSLMIQLLNNKYKKDVKGITLPTCLSINNIVSHYSYDESNDYEVKEGDIIKIELACHIDNNVASIGDTIKVGDPTFNESDLMIAANKALEIGIKNIQLDQDIYLFSDILQKVAKCFNLKVVKRQNKDESMVYDWIFRDTERFNEPSWIIKKEHELVLEDDELDSEEIYINEMFSRGEAYHMSVAFCRCDTIKNSESDGVLFQKSFKRHNLKSKYARELMSKIEKDYDKEFFKLDKIDMSDTRKKFGLKECLEKDVLRSLGIMEGSSEEIVYLKCTIIIQNNTVYKLTGSKCKFQSSELLSDELNNIITSSSKFDKKEFKKIE